MVTQFALRKQKKNAAGECPVYLFIYFDGQRLTYATGEKCRPSDWNADRQQFRRSYPLADDANALLARLTTQVLGWWRGERAAGALPTIINLRAALRPAAVAPPTAPLSLAQELRAFLDERGMQFPADYPALHSTLVGALVGFDESHHQVVVGMLYFLKGHQVNEG
jgi:hypothetical protein